VLNIALVQHKIKKLAKKLPKKIKKPIQKIYPSECNDSYQPNSPLTVYYKKYIEKDRS